MVKTTRENILAIARDVFRKIEAALNATEHSLGNAFVDAAYTISVSNGKVITLGIGKSGLVARKIAATMTSTGTPAVFIHPVECLHGDMGMISHNDIAIVLSNSGESDEIRKLMIFLTNRKIKTIALTGSAGSHLAQAADITIIYKVPQEACPMGMAPMASTTMQMVIGDALAAALIKINNFKPNDFALFHPAGALGKKLLLRVSDLMHKGDDNPVVKSGTKMRDVLVIMTEKAMGAVLVVGDCFYLEGIVTDGDLRRAIQKHGDLLDMNVDEIMTRNPISVLESEKAINALHLMEKRSSQINVLPVINDDRQVTGIIRLHDLVLAGL